MQVKSSESRFGAPPATLLINPVTDSLNYIRLRTWLRSFNCYRTNNIDIFQFKGMKDYGIGARLRLRRDSSSSQSSNKSRVFGSRSRKWVDIEHSAVQTDLRHNDIRVPSPPLSPPFPFFFRTLFTADFLRGARILCTEKEKVFAGRFWALQGQLLPRSPLNSAIKLGQAENVRRG